MNRPTEKACRSCFAASSAASSSASCCWLCATTAAASAAFACASPSPSCSSAQVALSVGDGEMGDQHPDMGRRIERRGRRRRLVRCRLGRVGRAGRGIARARGRTWADRAPARGSVAGATRPDHQQQDDEERPTSPMRAPVHEGEGHGERGGRGNRPFFSSADGRPGPSNSQRGSAGHGSAGPV